VAVAGLGWPTYLRLTGQAGARWVVPVDVVLLSGFALAYVWFGVSVAAAVHRLGRGKGLYVAWLVAAPVLWIVLPIPVLSTVILASPLSLKMLLSRQLRSEIHDRTFER
jgi:hypothetical protein